MSIPFTKRTLFSGILLASSLSTMVYAHPEEGFTITPSVGYMHTDTNQHLKDNASYSIGLGYQFDNPFAVEAVYLHSSQKQNGKHQHINQYRIDGLYNLPEFQNTNLTPYLAAGIGNTDIHQTINTNHMDVNAGGGIKYAINPALAVRADFRLVKDVQANHLSNVTSVGVQYTFGSSMASTKSDNSASD